MIEQMVFYIENLLWECPECLKNEMVGVIIASPTESQKIKEVAMLTGYKIRSIHENHKDAWEIHKKYSNDSYEEFLKKNPVPNDNEIIKNSFKNYGFEIISDSKNNTVGVDY